MHEENKTAMINKIVINTLLSEKLHIFFKLDLHMSWALMRAVAHASVTAMFKLVCHVYCPFACSISVCTTIRVPGGCQDGEQRIIEKGRARIKFPFYLDFHNCSGSSLPPMRQEISFLPSS